MSDAIHSAPRKFQIFISSTYTDLIEERPAVTEVILSMGHIPVGMELFAASNEDQWSYIKKRILEVDYYLVIIAERYGSEAPDGLSYTEMEYRFATDHGVPLAALLLHSAARAQWPSGKIDFEKRKKVDDFRALCQQRLVDYWSDAGTLTTKTMLALNNLVSTYPRRGWIAGDQAISPQLAAELARLSEENARLRAQIETLQAGQGADKSVELAASRLLQPLRVEVQKASKRFEPYRELLADPVTSKMLETTSLFDFAFLDPAVFLDGAEDVQFDKAFEKFLVQRLDSMPSEEAIPRVMRLVSAFTFLLRTWGLLEASTIVVPQVSGSGTRTAKFVKFSTLGRNGFERAMTEFMEHAEPPP